MSNIIERQKIELSKSQIKMVKSGWGDDSVDKAVVEKITYNSDGLRVKGYIAYPIDMMQKYPCIIWNRGGFGNAGAIDSFNATGIFGQLASWGYVVFASQYRGNDGGEGEDEFGGSDVKDVLNLISLGNEVENADISIWGIEGWSRGGMMTYLVLTKTNIFKSAIVSGGIANLNCNADESPFMKKLYQARMGKYDKEEFKINCDARSVINFADKLSKETPLLILHGSADKRVLPHDSIDLSAKLIRDRSNFRFVLLEDGDHFLKSYRKEVDILRKSWFDKYLKKQSNSAGRVNL